jgi:hypothetical protein
MILPIMAFHGQRLWPQSAHSGTISLVSLMPPWRGHVGILEKRTVFCRQKFSLQGNQYRLSIKEFVIKANITISFGSQAARNLTPTQRVPGFFGSRASLLDRFKNMCLQNSCHIFGVKYSLNFK